MRILTDIRLLGRGVSSGIEEYTQELLRALLKIDRENNYIYFYNGLHKAALATLFKNTGAVIDWHIPNKLMDGAARFLGQPKLENLIEFDVIFSPHFNILASGRPRVITFHDLSFIHHPDFFSWRQHVWHWLQNCKKQAQSAQRIIAVSEFTKSDLVEIFQIPPEKVSVIYSGVGSEFKVMPRDSSALSEFRRARKLNRPFILYMGTLEPRKNVVALIRAFNMLKQDRAFKDFELVVAGAPGWLYDEIIRAMDQSPFRDDIRLTGAVKNEERVCLYNLAQLFVYPSFFEGFGFPPLEAQACGVPVVASNRTSLPEILGESASLVDPWRIDELHSAMKEILIGKAIQEKFRNLGAANVKRFDWAKTARETLGLLETISNN